MFLAIFNPKFQRKWYNDSQLLVLSSIIPRKTNQQIWCKRLITILSGESLFTKQSAICKFLTCHALFNGFLRECNSLFMFSHNYFSWKSAFREEVELGNGWTLLSNALKEDAFCVNLMELHSLLGQKARALPFLHSFQWTLCCADIVQKPVKGIAAGKLHSGVQGVNWLWTKHEKTTRVKDGGLSTVWGVASSLSVRGALSGQQVLKNRWI